SAWCGGISRSSTSRPSPVSFCWSPSSATSSRSPTRNAIPRSSAGSATASGWFWGTGVAVLPFYPAAPGGRQALKGGAGDGGPVLAADAAAHGGGPGRVAGVFKEVTKGGGGAGGVVAGAGQDAGHPQAADALGVVRLVVGERDHQHRHPRSERLADGAD